MGRDVDASLAGFAAMRWVQRQIRAQRHGLALFVARNHGFKEQALRTCEAMLRIHRATEGSTADRARIARMVAEEPAADRAGLPMPRDSSAAS